jgi:hypothetical protein
LIYSNFALDAQRAAQCCRHPPALCPAGIARLRPPRIPQKLSTGFAIGIHARLFLTHFPTETPALNAA